MRRLAPWLLCLLLPLAFTARAQAAPSALLVLHDAGRMLTLLDAQNGTKGVAATLPTPLSGPLQISPDGARLYGASTAGDIVQLALPGLALIARASAPVGPGTPLLALSGDGRWLLAAGAQASVAQIFDAATLAPAKRIAIETPDARQHSRAAQLLSLPSRQSWLLAPEALNELWEISWNPGAAPIYDGLVHDYRMGEALPRSGFLGVRRTPLPAPLPELLVPEGSGFAVGAQPCQRPTPCTLRMFHLDTRSQMASWRVQGMPHPAASAAWMKEGRVRLALAGLDQAAPPWVLPQGRPDTGPVLPAKARRILHGGQPPAPWVQREDGVWLRLEPDTLQAQGEIQAPPDTELLLWKNIPILVAPGSDGYVSLRDPATLRERLRLPFSGLVGAWLLHP